MNPEELETIAEKEKGLKQSFKHLIHVCGAAGCLSQHSEAVKEAFDLEIKKRGLEKQCRIKRVGCLGLCAMGPLVALEGENILYHNVTVEMVPSIVEALDKTPLAKSRLSLEEPFFSHQNKIVLDTCGRVDPERIEDYIALGGYRALRQALCEMRPGEVIEQVTRSGLRGRGGAGFPTGLKWSAVSKTVSTRRFVICNADEGDPGAFMDRTILASDPHKVIEGIIIGAYAVGALEGYIYVRAEYPLAIKRLRTAIHQAERMGFIGKNVFGTSFNFSLELRLGAGAFVCGEETALIASIEGKRGTPRPRPPFPAEVGLWGEPTMINNVETFAHVPRIILEGGDWYAKLGTEKSKGTKMFALAGRVKNSGLIEVPMGTTLREIIFNIGGIPEGHRFKAVQTGGPSGGCIPEQFLDTPVDYESLSRLGSIMGSGGMVIMDETSCMVDVAKYFIDFCKAESCGKCVPCRVGTAQMHEILCRITNGVGTMDDLTLLEELCDLVRNTSLCALGQTSANPILSTLRYFRDEYIAHIEKKTCPAGVCKIRAGGP
jgi:bidirectional [NiFe] hydrogenase diaphorase subunit